MMDIVLAIIVFVLALISIAATISVVGAVNRWPGEVFRILMFLTVCTSLVTVLLSGRSMRTGEWGLVVESEAVASDGILAKLALVLTIGVAVAFCVGRLTYLWNGKSPIYRMALSGFEFPKNIVVSFVIFYISFSIFPILFGHVYYFHPSLIYPFFVILALLLWAPSSITDPVVIAKQVLVLIVVGSLLAALVMPTLALQPAYTGFLPSFKHRLYGLTAHANTLGAVASVCFLLEYAEPTKKRFHRNAVLLLSFIALVLTQSKTSIIATFAGILVIYLWRVRDLSFQIGRVRSKFNNIILIGFLVVFLGAVSILCFWIMFSDSSLLSLLEKKLDPRLVQDATTGTGRIWIWEVAIMGGMENPLFGQGADFWNLNTRIRYGLSGAFHAHNLFLQVFSRSGFVGLLSLLIFLFYLIVYSLRAAKVTRGGSLALLVLFVIRTVFEVPIQVNSILGGEFFAMMAFIIYVVDRGAKPIGNLKNCFESTSIDIARRAND